MLTNKTTITKSKKFKHILAPNSSHYMNSPQPLITLVKRITIIIVAWKSRTSGKHLKTVPIVPFMQCTANIALATVAILLHNLILNMSSHF